MKRNGLASWAIFATQVGESSPAWQAGFALASREAVLTAAAKVARGEVNPAVLIWRAP